MLPIILVDQVSVWNQFLPITYMKSVADLRIGIMTIKEKWESYFSNKVSILPLDHLSELYIPVDFGTDEYFWIFSHYFPNLDICEQILNLKSNQALIVENEVVSFRGSKLQWEDANFDKKEIDLKIEKLNHVTDLYLKNGNEIRNDYNLVTKDRKTQSINDAHLIIYNSENVFIEDGAKLKACVINAENGPVYIGKNAEIKIGALIEGPFALCENARVNMGAKIRPNCTVGPNSVVGGEVNNAILQANSNKGHEGYLGNSVLGEFCNLGADTNNSNLKNNFSDVKIWNISERKWDNTGLKNCGLIMGDHSKAGINTMFNTGTVVGIGVNHFGADFPVKYIPNFTWGMNTEKYQFDKFIEAETLWMKTKNKTLTESYLNVLKYYYESNFGI